MFTFLPDNMAILIVDDDEQMLNLLSETLKSAFETDIFTASSGLEALALIEKIEVDLVVLDYMMPELNGTQTCEAIKKIPKMWDVPVIMITANEEPETLKSAFDAGVTDFITKPPDLMEVVVRVRSALKLKKEIDIRKAHEHELTILTKELEEARKVQEEKLKESEKKREILQNLLNISPQQEILSHEAQGETLDPKRIYLVLEEQPEKVFEIFANEVHCGRYGLAITRKPPGNIQEKYNLHKTPFVWLTNAMTENDQIIEPGDLIHVSSTVSSFFNKTENCVILLEGIEFLTTHNGFASMLKLLQHLNSMVMQKDTILIIALDPYALERKEYHLLSHECELIDYRKNKEKF